MKCRRSLPPFSALPEKDNNRLADIIDEVQEGYSAASEKQSEDLAFWGSPTPTAVYGAAHGEIAARTARFERVLQQQEGCGGISGTRVARSERSLSLLSLKTRKTSSCVTGLILDRPRCPTS